MERAYDELKSIIVDGKHSVLSREEGVALCDKLVDEYRSSPLLQSLKKQFET